MSVGIWYDPAQALSCATSLSCMTINTEKSAQMKVIVHIRLSSFSELGSRVWISFRQIKHKDDGRIWITFSGWSEAWSDAQQRELPRIPCNMMEVNYIRILLKAVWRWGLTNHSPFMSKYMDIIANTMDKSPRNLMWQLPESGFTGTKLTNHNWTKTPSGIRT